MEGASALYAAQRFARWFSIPQEAVRLYGVDHERITALLRSTREGLRSALRGGGEAGLLLAVSSTNVLPNAVPLQKRPHKGSNEEWEHPQGPDAQITKMKDGRTHLGHMVEPAVDMASRVAVTLQPADQRDSETVKETLAEAGEKVAAEANRSGQALEAVAATGAGEGPAQLRTPVETGGIQRARLRRYPDILKRLLAHVLPFNQGLVIRKVPGRGTPRGCKDAPVDLAVILLCLRKEALKLASITCPRRSDGLHAFPRLQSSLPRQLPKSLFLLPPDRRCNPAWVDVVWLNGMPPWQTERSRVFSYSRHLKLPMPWPISFCGQKSSGWRFTEFRSDFYLSRQFSHSFLFTSPGKQKRNDVGHCRTPAENRRPSLPFRDRGLVDVSEYGGQELDPESETRVRGRDLQW